MFNQASIQMDIKNMIRGKLPREGAMRVVCPSCGGGRDRERSMSIRHTDKGVAFYCFRDRCKVRGYVDGSVTFGTKRDNSTNTASQKLEIQALPEEYYQYLPVKDTSVAPLWEPNRQMVLYPVLSYMGSELGYVQRLYRPLNSWWSGPKAINTIHNPDSTTPFLHFPLLTRQNFSGTIVVVEDWPSAEAIAKYKPSCALLGTNLSDDGVEHLLSLGVRKLGICLDNDALATAARMKRGMELFFDQVIVMFVDKDPKDMNDKELQERFG